MALAEQSESTGETSIVDVSLLGLAAWAMTRLGVEPPRAR